MIILITGATGFIGRHLLYDILSDDQYHQIRVLSRKPKPTIAFADKVKIFKGDLAIEESLEEAFEGTDVLINIAAELKDKDKFERTNIIGTRNIIALAIKYKIRRIIHLSSVGVVGAQYSFNHILVDENYACSPKNEYERTKLESERMFLEATAQKQFKLVILRPTNVIGEGHPGSFLLNFFKYINSGKPFFLMNNALVNYVYVKDVTFAIRHFVSNETNEIVFNIGESIRLKDFAELNYKLLSVKPNRVGIPVIFIRIFEGINYFGIIKLRDKSRTVSNAVEYDSNKLKRIMEYKFGLREGLAKTLAYYISAGKLK